MSKFTESIVKDIYSNLYRNIDNQLVPIDFEFSNINFILDSALFPVRLQSSLILWVDFLLGTNFDSLIKLLEIDKKFFETTEEKIKYKLHPILALKILQRFEFTKHKIFVRKKIMNEYVWVYVYQIETVDHWLDKLYIKDNFNQKIIKENIYLINYLRLVSHFINVNTPILNKFFFI